MEQVRRTVGVCGRGYCQGAGCNGGVGYTVHFLEVLLWGQKMGNKTEFGVTLASGCLDILAGHIGH